MTFRSLGVLSFALLVSANAVQPSLNFDFQGIGDFAYNGDQGALSQPFGTYWNVVTPLGTPGVVRDEFNLATPYTASFAPSAIVNNYPSGLSGNTLQDTGLDNGILISNLPFTKYEYAMYVSANTYIGVKHAGGSTGQTLHAAPTPSLPGSQGQEYLASQQPVMPYEISPGNYGLGFGYDGQVDGLLMGLQLRPVTPHAVGAQSVTTGWDLRLNPPTSLPDHDSGFVEHPTNAGHSRSLANSNSTPQTIVSSDATGGINPFGGGSIGAKATVSQVGVRGDTLPQGGQASSAVWMTSNFQTVGSTGAVDVDVQLTLDGFLDIVGKLDHSGSATALSEVTIHAAITSSLGSVHNLFNGTVRFFGSDTNISLEGDTENWALDGEMSFNQHLTQTGVDNGGLLNVSLNEVYQDTITAIPGEILQLIFAIETFSAIEPPSGGFDAEFATADFFHTLGMTPTTDTPGVSFVQVVPEPASATALVALALLRRRRA
jgi:hypothetical protein